MVDEICIFKYFQRCVERQVSKWMQYIFLNHPWFHCFQGWVVFQFLVRLKSVCRQSGANENNVVSHSVPFQASWDWGKTLSSLSVALKSLALGQKSNLRAKSPEPNPQTSPSKLENNWEFKEGSSYAEELPSRLIRCKILVSMLSKHCKWC